MSGGRLPRLTAGLDHAGPLSYVRHLALHGELDADGWAPEALIREVDAAGLRGRGGAGFPTAVKLRAVAGARRAVVVANGSEGEPLARKDRVLLERGPHLVIDGALLAAPAVGARDVLLAVAEGARRAQDSLDTALHERDDARGVRIATVPDRFLAGEETALVRFLGGGPLKPTLTPPRPAERGVRRRPTLVQNVETLAHLALIGRHGAAWFREVGVAAAPGSALVTLSGAVAHPGVYEIAIGASLTGVLAAAGGPAEPLRAVLVGGYFGSWLDGDGSGVTLDPDGLRAHGAALGAAVLVALGASACPVAETARAMRWMAAQSAGQCGPCVHGLAAIAGTVESLAAGRADRHAPARLARWADEVEGRGACRHPDGAVRFLRSALRVFADEVADHRRHGLCDACLRPAVLATPGLRAAA